MPRRRELVERTLLAVAFLLWALSQLIDPSRLATIANDDGILLLGFDLGLIIRDQIEAAADTDGDGGASRGGEDAPRRTRTGPTSTACFPGCGPSKTRARSRPGG
jgi:hypothetical protein